MEYYIILDGLILYYIVLYCVLVYYVLLYYIILYYTILYNIISQKIVYHTQTHLVLDIRDMVFIYIYIYINNAVQPVAPHLSAASFASFAGIGPW